ncbi:MAG: helix-turn-helix domain-containing protein [Bacteroidales bacterium]|nr:helix-turn-helix domain-containing protein [Bacteroidales bacterium]
MEKIELPSMANTSTVCYTISHDDLIDFANVIIQKSQEVAEQQSANHESQEEYLTRKEVMAIMKRCDSTMTKWARTGYLEPVRVGGKHLYRKSDVEKLMSH